MDKNYGQVSAPMMGPVEAVKTCFNKYVDFSGRASRAEFWWWILFTNIVGWLVSLFGPSSMDILSYTNDSEGIMEMYTENSGYFIVSGIISLVFLLPTLGVWVRRLHDIGCSGWWLLLYFTCIGIVALLIMAVIPSQRYNNQYGLVPGTVSADNDPDYRH